MLNLPIRKRTAQRAALYLFVCISSLSLWTIVVCLLACHRCSTYYSEMSV